ncbi:MAG TPA: lysophospholipid transporter LplT [Burkholderiales bacterium]|jgi:MFS family permease|nr:lysophospholipid transporter LplT [Burkholderiales bacterium]
MKRGFYTIMAAQFFSSLADNALLIAAIQLLAQLSGPPWMVPLLKFFFTISYVALAAFVGAFADSMPKGRVMFITNMIKVAGCLMMFFYAQLTPSGVDEFLTVLIAYAVVGLGAAAYSPAKYGILTELLPPSQLVAANGWIEGLTVGSIILGTLAGGVLVSETVSRELLAIDLPRIDTHVDTPGEAAVAIIVLGYVVAAIFNLFIPDTGVDHHLPKKNPFYLIRDFAHCNNLLWKDKLGQISLATTTLFWGAGATLQFIVLEWARAALGYPLSKATALQGITAVGIAAGAVAAARYISLRQAVSVLPVGIAMGVIVIGMNFVRDLWVAIPLLVAVGGLAGFFVVPMNALLQHRGHILMGAGHSIAVQNFNENLSILVMLALYAVMIRVEFSVFTIIVLFGLFVSGSMMLVRKRHLYNQRQGDSLHLIGMDKPDR